MIRVVQFLVLVTVSGCGADAQRNTRTVADDFDAIVSKLCERAAQCGDTSVRCDHRAPDALHDEPSTWSTSKLLSCLASIERASCETLSLSPTYECED